MSFSKELEITHDLKVKTTVEETLNELKDYTINEVRIYVNDHEYFDLKKQDIFLLDFCHLIKQMILKDGVTVLI